jgi:hypothetical protein
LPLARFETSHVLGAQLASSPLLALAWDRCVAATDAASGFIHGDDGGSGGTVYVAFSGVQVALSAAAAGAGAAVAGGGAGAFAPVGLSGDAVRRLFAPHVAAEPDSATGEPVAVQALALQSFSKLSACLDFQVIDWLH